MVSPQSHPRRAPSTFGVQEAVQGLRSAECCQAGGVQTPGCIPYCRLAGLDLEEVYVEAIILAWTAKVTANAGRELGESKASDAVPPVMSLQFSVYSLDLADEIADHVRPFVVDVAQGPSGWFERLRFEDVVSSGAEVMWSGPWLRCRRIWRR